MSTIVAKFPFRLEIHPPAPSPRRSSVIIAKAKSTHPHHISWRVLGFESNPLHPPHAFGQDAQAQLHGFRPAEAVEADLAILHVREDEIGIHPGFIAHGK